MAYPTYKDHLLDALGYADQECPDAALFETVQALGLLLETDVVLATISEPKMRRVQDAMGRLRDAAVCVLNHDQTGGI